MILVFKRMGDFSVSISVEDKKMLMGNDLK